MKYLICLDLDGTTLNSNGKLNSETVDYIKKIKNDHIVCIVTGRPLRTSIQFYNEFGLDTVICNYNGTKLSNPVDRNFVESSFCINLDELKQFYDIFNEDIYDISLESGEQVYTVKETEIFNDWGTAKKNIIKMQDVNFAPNGVVLLLHDDRVYEAYEHFINRESTIGMRTWKGSQIKNYTICEIYSLLADKGTAIEFLKQYWAIFSTDSSLNPIDSHLEIYVSTILS